MVSDQFDYVEFNLIKKENLYTVAYMFVKVDHNEQRVVAGFSIETAISGLTYVSCGEEIQKLLMLGMFKVPTMATGSVYDEYMVPIADLNWNKIMNNRHDIYDGESTYLQ